MPFQSIDHASAQLAVDPQPHVRRAGLGIADAVSRRRTRVSSLPHAACVIAWHAVSNWCVQFCFGSVHLPGGGEAARERHARRACRSGIAASGQVDHGQRYDVFSHDTTFSPSWPQRDHEVVEVVFELGDDDAGLDGVHPDPPPVRVGVEIEVGNAARRRR